MEVHGPCLQKSKYSDLTNKTGGAFDITTVVREAVEF